MNPQLLKVDEFSFDIEDLILLVSTMKFALLSEAQQSNSYGKRNHALEMFRNTDDIDRLKSSYRERKSDWVARWIDKTAKSLLIENKLLGIGEINQRFKDIATDEKKLMVFVVEFANFNPYFNLDGEPEREGGLKFTGEDKVFYYQDLNYQSGGVINIAKLSAANERFESCIKGMSKIVSGKNHSWTLLGVGILVASLLIDPIAGSIGAAMELSGGAAFLAGLAFLGGGAIASGGLGITGGMIVIMAGGAIVGFGTGSAEYDARLKKSRKEQLFLHCGKLFAYAYVSNLSKDEFRKICERVLDLQKEFEDEADKLAISKDSKSDLDTVEEKAKVLGAFRKYIRATY